MTKSPYEIQWHRNCRHVLLTGPWCVSGETIVIVLGYCLEYSDLLCLYHVLHAVPHRSGLLLGTCPMSRNKSSGMPHNRKSRHLVLLSICCIVSPFVSS
jgi:hypothetical protein